MRNRLILCLVLSAFTALALSSCSESEEVVGKTIHVSEESAAMMGDVEVDTLPTDDIDEYIVDMPDGVHLRPGVDVFRIVEPAKSMLIFEEGTDQVIVPAPAVSAFDDIGERDLVFVGEDAFIVKKKEYDRGMLVIEKGPVILADLIYGNFRIPFKLDMRKWFEAKGLDYEIVEREVVGEDGVRTRQQHIQIADESWPKKTFSPDGAEFEIDAGHLRMNAEMEGQFEGRIGSFNEHHDCGPVEEYSCGRRGRRTCTREPNFCVDRLAIWADARVSTAGGLKATARQDVPLWDPDPEDFGGPVTVGRYPLGTTGISVYIDFFLREKVTVEAYGKVEVEARWNTERAMPIGWVYDNSPNGVGFEVLPRPEQVRRISDDNDFDAALAAGLEASYELAVGLEFGVSDFTGTAKLRGGDIGAAFQVKANYEPLKAGIALEREDWCFKLEVAAEARLRAYLTFEVDFRIWDWESSVACTRDEPCGTLSEEIFKLELTDNAELCQELAYDALEIEVVNPDEPPGFDSLDGYDIDSICKYRTLAASPRAGRPTAEEREVCITTDGLDSNSNTCPVDPSEAIGLTGTRRFDFGEKILPGDVIRVNQPGNAACNGGGSVKFRLVGGSLSDSRVHEFFNGEPHEGSATLTF